MSVAIKFIFILINGIVLVSVEPDQLFGAGVFAAGVALLCMLEPVRYARKSRKFFAIDNQHAIDALPTLKSMQRAAKILSRLIWWMVGLILGFSAFIGLISSQGFDTSPGMLAFAVMNIGLGSTYRTYNKSLLRRIEMLKGQKEEQIGKALERDEIKSLDLDEIKQFSRARFRYIGYLAGELGGVWALLSLYTGSALPVTDMLFIISGSIAYLTSAPLFAGAYRVKVKRHFLPGILEKHDLTYSDKKLFDMDELLDHGIVSTYRRQVVDDAFSGTINGRKIDVQEFILSEHDPDEARHFAKQENIPRWIFYTLLTPVFKLLDMVKSKSMGEKGLYRRSTFTVSQCGVAVRIPLNRKLYCHTLVFSKGLLAGMKDRFPGYKSVGLLNSKLNQFYDVYANDQVESRVIFDPAFMERFAELVHRLPMADIEVSFKNQEMLMLCLSDTDSFEVGGLYGGLKPESFEPILRQIETYTDIIKLLELDPDRGL